MIDTALVVAEALRHERRVKQEALSSIQARRGVSEASAANRLNASLSATLGLDQTAKRIEDAYRDPFDRQQLALSVDLPLWQWGAGGDEVEAARADRAGQESRAERTQREVAEEALFAARGLLLARDQLTIAAKADTVGTKRFEVAKNRYVIGKIGIADLYLAQSEKDAALEAYVQALRGYWLAYYELRRLTLYDFARATSLVTESGE
ncbi:MAG: TolC family protein [Candidatus Eisenbacteria bacterium]